MKISLTAIVLILLTACVGFSQGFKKMQIDHDAIYVVDLKKSRNFYVNILGLDTIPEPFKDGKHIWLSLGRGVQLHIISGAAKAKEYFQYNHLCLGTDDLTAFTKMLVANKIGWVDTKGVPDKITTRPDGVHQLWVRDPDGYWIEVNDANK